MKSKFFIIFVALFLAQLYLASALTITSATSNPAEVQPGEKFSLNLKIENNLDEKVEDVVVNLVLNTATSTIPFAPYQSSNEARIDEIDDDDREDANFDLMVFSDAVSGTYTIPVRVSYTLDNGTRITDESLGVVSVVINAKPGIEISTEGDVLIRGSMGKVTIRIINSGLGDAKFLSVSMNPVSGIQITNSNKAYIGNIDSNDFDSADFDIFISANAQSTINLPVELEYTDSQNNQIKETKIVSLKTYTIKEATALGLVKKGNTTLVIFSVIGAFILFLIYRRARKKRKNKRSGQ